MTLVNKWHTACIIKLWILWIKFQVRNKSKLLMKKLFNNNTITCSKKPALYNGTLLKLSAFEGSILGTS